METTSGKYVPVAGPITGMHRAGKGRMAFKIQKVHFSLPENSTFSKVLRGAAKAIVIYEKIEGDIFPRVVDVIPNYTGQQVLWVNSKYPA